MAQSQFAAFRLGFRDARRFHRWGMRPDPDTLSPRIAEAMRPQSLATGVGSIAAYINGFYDGCADDYFRLDAIETLEHQGFRF